MEWDYDNDPTEDGWYAVLVCYDPQEGIFPMAAYWNGRWEKKCVIAIGHRCNTEAEAERLAYDHDPEA